MGVVGGGFEDEWRTRGRVQGKKKNSIKKNRPPLFRSWRRLGRPTLGIVGIGGKRRKKKRNGRSRCKNGRVIFSVQRIMGELYHRLKEPLAIIDDIIFRLRRVFSSSITFRIMKHFPTFLAFFPRTNKCQFAGET